MRTVHKFPLEINRTDLDLPAGSILRSVQVQRGNPCVWVELDDDSSLPKVEHLTLIFIGTGQPVPMHGGTQPLSYLDTFQMHEGELVFHLYYHQAKL